MCRASNLSDAAVNKPRPRGRGRRARTDARLRSTQRCRASEPVHDGAMLSLATAPMLILAQRSAGQATLEILIWLVVLLAGSLLLALLGFWVVRRLRREPSAQLGFSLADLRRLRDEGELTEAQYRQARSSLIGAAKAVWAVDEEDAKPSHRGGPNAPADGAGGGDAGAEQPSGTPPSPGDQPEQDGQSFIGWKQYDEDETFPRDNLGKQEPFDDESFSDLELPFGDVEFDDEDDPEDEGWSDDRSWRGLPPRGQVDQPDDEADDPDVDSEADGPDAGPDNDDDDNPFLGPPGPDEGPDDRR